MIESPAHILPIAAEAYGDKVALITEDAQLSFTELEARSNQLVQNMGQTPRALTQCFLFGSGSALVELYADRD